MCFKELQSVRDVPTQWNGRVHVCKKHIYPASSCAFLTISPEGLATLAVASPSLFGRAPKLEASYGTDMYFIVKFTNIQSCKNTNRICIALQINSSFFQLWAQNCHQDPWAFGPGNLRPPDFSNSGSPVSSVSSISTLESSWSVVDGICMYLLYIKLEAKIYQFTNITLALLFPSSNSLFRIRPMIVMMFLPYFKMFFPHLANPTALRIAFPPPTHHALNVMRNKTMPRNSWAMLKKPNTTHDFHLFFVHGVQSEFAVHRKIGNKMGVSPFVLHCFVIINMGQFSVSLFLWVPNPFAWFGAMGMMKRLLTWTQILNRPHIHAPFAFAVGSLPLPYMFARDLLLSKYPRTTPFWKIQCGL